MPTFPGNSSTPELINTLWNEQSKWMLNVRSSPANSLSFHTMGKDLYISCRGEAESRIRKPASCFFKGLVLALSYSKHLGATRGAYALGCWLAVFHGDAFGIFHFLFGAAFHAVCLHLSTSLFSLSWDYTIREVEVNSEAKVKREALPRWSVLYLEYPVLPTGRTSCRLPLALVVGGTGLEPVTSCVWSKRSNHWANRPRTYLF